MNGRFPDRRFINTPAYKIVETVQQGDITVVAVARIVVIVAEVADFGSRVVLEAR